MKQTKLFKKLLTLGLMLMLGTLSAAFGQTITSTSTGGLWSAASTWVGGIQPAPTNDVVIADGATVTIDANAQAASITVGQGINGILTFDGVAARAVTITGNLNIAVGGTFIVQSTGTFTNTMSVGGNITNNGTLDMSRNSSTTICNVTFNGTGEQTLSGTTPVLTRFRGITLSKSTKDDKVKSTIDTQFGGSGLLLLTKGTWEQYAGNLINLSGNQTLGSADGVLLIDGTGGFTNYNGTTYTSASLAVSTGTFTVNTSGTVQIGTGANSVTCTTPGIINLTSGTVLINGRLTITTGTCTINGANIFINPQPTFTGASALGASSNAFEVSGTSGTFNFTSGSVTLVNPTKAATTGRDLKLTSTGTVNISAGATIYVGDGVSTLTNIGGGTYDGFINGSSISIPNLVIQTGGITGRNFGLKTNLTVDNLTMISGAIEQVASSGTVSYNSGGSLTYNGTSAQTTTAVELPTTNGPTNLKVNNPFGVTLSGPTTINGVLRTSSTLTNNNTLTINGIFQLDEGGWATGTDFVYGAAGTLAFNNSTGFYGVSGTPVFWPTTNGPVNVTVQNTGGMQLEVPRAVTGIFQTSAGVKNTFGNNLTVLGTVKLNTGGYFDNFSPTYTNTSTLEYNTGGNYGTYNEWIEGSTVGYGVPQNVTLSNSTTVDLSGNRTVVGNLSLSSGDMNTNGKTLILAGTTSGSGSILTGTTGMVSYDGTAPQTISNLKDNTVNQLAINNLAGVSLSTPTTAGSLLLVSGDLFLGANDLTLLNPSGLLQIHPVPSMSYIVTDGVGKLIKMVTPGPVNLIPVGASATSYDPVNLSPAAPALFSVNVSTTLPADAPAQYTYAPKVWDISVVAGPPPPSTTVTLTPSNPVATVTSDVIGHYTGGAYTNETATRSGNDYTATFTSFSPFVTGTYDIGTSVSRTVIDGISFDGRTVYNPANISLQVYDAAGRLTVSSTKNINMSSYPKGIYIVRSPQGTQKIALMK